MVKKIGFDSNNENNQTRNNFDKDLHGKCEAWGCTRWGHINIGKWYCRYHWACHGEDIAGQLSHVSKILSNHEPEINWLETLQASNEVDWEFKLKHRVPVGMECLEGEEFNQYRKRLEGVVASLLAYKKMRPIYQDRKLASSGEDGLKSFGEFAPEF